MNNRGKALLKTIHVLSACTWLGSIASVVLLQCLRGWSNDLHEVSALNLHFSIMDFALIIPGTVGSLVTGFFICKTTSWGFFRYRWVIAKWVLTLYGIVTGSALLGPWQLQMVALSGGAAETQGLTPDYDLIRLAFTLVGLVQVLVLVLTVAISIRKPWGRRRVTATEKVSQDETPGISVPLTTEGGLQ